MTETAALEQMLHHARDAWPTIDVAHSQFRAFASARAGDQAWSARGLQELYLVCACVQRADNAIAEFETYCRPAIDSAIARIGGAAQVADEIRQRVRDLLFVGKDGQGTIASYGGRGSLLGWVRIITVREALRQVRETRKYVGEDEAMFDALAPTDQVGVELAHLKAHYRERFRVAFRQAIDDLPRRERTSLRMNVLDGASIDEIALTFGIHRSSAARWLAGARDRLLVTTREKLMSELGIDQNEVDSVIRLIRSNIDMSLGDALRSRGD